ncbi:MAG: hypothetical protein JWN46_251 [Acidimicrobiales bacterium]|nr:hypothetical protein [Acidimicrobiales bacterium]
MTSSADLVDRPPVPQVCQRCRRTFPGDATLPPASLIEWWACDACRTVLLGSQRATPSA